MVVRMPRPPDVTEERIAAWMAQLPPQPERALKKKPIVEAGANEAACAGYWLEEKLIAETSLDEDQRYDVLTANGQICFGRDPWKVSETTLFLLKNSAKIPKAGKKLAEDLVHGRLDGIYGPGPGVHSKEAVERMKAAMGITDVREILELAGASSVEEARAKIEAEAEEMEKEFEK